MISIDELKKMAKIKGLSLGNAEKDYLIDIVLLLISRNTKDELVFKGGTCLYKFHNLDRFSEDIDFSINKKLDVGRLVQKIMSDLKLFGIESKIFKKRDAFDSILITLRIKGPLYKGVPQGYSKIGIDINLKSSVELEPVTAFYTSLFPLPGVSMLIMQEKEILAEKVMAIMTRGKARDVYDLWFLLKQGTDADINLVKKKLEYYKLDWDIREFERMLDMKKAVWKTELKPLVVMPPDFDEAKRVIVEKIK